MKFVHKVFIYGALTCNLLSAPLSAMDEEAQTRTVLPPAPPAASACGSSCTQETSPLGKLDAAAVEGAHFEEEAHRILIKHGILKGKNTVTSPSLFYESAVWLQDEQRHRQIPSIEIVVCFLASANQNYFKAKYKLGGCLHMGKKDFPDGPLRTHCSTQTEYWLTKMADLGDSEADHILLYLYFFDHVGLNLSREERYKKYGFHLERYVSMVNRKTPEFDHTFHDVQAKQSGAWTERYGKIKQSEAKTSDTTTATTATATSATATAAGPAPNVGGAATNPADSAVAPAPVQVQVPLPGPTPSGGGDDNGTTAVGS